MEHNLLKVIVFWICFEVNYFNSQKKKSREEHRETKSHFTDVNLFKDYTKVKPLTSTSEEEAGKSSKPETPSIENSDNDEVFQNNVQVDTTLPTNVVKYFCHER